MARRTKLSDTRLVQVIDRIASRKSYKRTSKWDRYVEGLTFQVVTRLKKPNHPLPKVKGWKPNISNWQYALIEIRRQELKLIKKTLRSHGL